MSLPDTGSICHRCREMRFVDGARSSFLMCTALPEKYPAQPVRECPAFVDARLTWPAPLRNREVILEVLRRVLPETGTVLEVASGSGQHIVHFARDLPSLEWQPSDIDAEGRASTWGWATSEGLGNVRRPLALDVTEPGGWPDATDAIYCANMVHIAPWACCLGLLDLASKLLPSGAPLVTYGPYRFSGSFTAGSNAAFSERLKSRDPSWGVRDVDDIEREANARGISLLETVALPANNHVLVWRRD